MEEEKRRYCYSRDKGDKPGGSGAEAQLGLSDLDSKQETLMLSDG